MSKPTDTEIDPMQLLEALEGGADLDQLMLESRIVIKPGGQVIIENLTPDMLELAYALNPDDPGIHCRLDLAGRQQVASEEESAPETHES